MKNDLISRQAAIDAVKWGITYARAINTCTGETKELFKVSNHALNEAVERLKELPSAQPKPSQIARDIATIIENEKDMRVVRKNAELLGTQMSLTNCEDAVSRKKVIGIFTQLWDCIGTIMDRDEWEDVCKTTANELPSVQPERKKGEWLPDNNSLYEMRFVCSECKTSEIVPTIGFTKYKPIWDFCPNCGADMRTPVEIARDIVHEAIDNSVWSDTVDVAVMHKIVDEYNEMRGEANADVES